MWYSVLEMLLQVNYLHLRRMKKLTNLLKKQRMMKNWKKSQIYPKNKKKNLQIVQVKLKKAKKDHQVIKQIQQKPQK